MLTDQDIPLDRIGCPFFVAFPVLGRRPSKDSDIAFGIDNSDLAAVFARESIFRHETIQYLLGGESLLQQLERARSVAHVDIGLRRHGAHACFSPRHYCAYGEVA